MDLSAVMGMQGMIPTAGEIRAARSARPSTDVALLVEIERSYERMREIARAGRGSDTPVDAAAVRRESSRDNNSRSKYRCSI